MQTSSSTSLSYTLIRVALYAIVALVVLIRPMQIFPDSLGYVDAWFNRPPVYPLIIDFLELLFGGYYLNALKVFQLGLGIFGIHYFVNQIRNITSLSNFWSFILTLLVAIPYVYNENIANGILTEALAYPLYLIIAVKSLGFLQYRNFKYLWQTIVLMFILLLIRKQFLFVLPWMVLISIWIGFKTKDYRKPAIAIMALLLLPVVVSQVDSIYHKARHGHYVSTPWTGIHLLAPAMYVADIEDVKLYDNPTEAQLFQEMYDIITEEKLTQQSQSDFFKSRGIDHYIYSFSKIANRTIYTDGKVQFEKSMSVNEALIALNETTTKMTLPLIKDNFLKWISIYVKNIMFGLGSSKLFLLLVLMAGVGLWNVRRNNVVFNVMGLFAAFTISNVVLIAIGMHTLKRFTFYNDWVLICIVILFIDYLMKNKSRATEE